MTRVILCVSMMMTCILAQAQNIRVGKKRAVTTIQQAVNLSHNGDTIFIDAGNYMEGTIRVTKSLTIIGQNDPVLDGEKKYEIFLISGKNITIRGFTLKNSGSSSMNDYAAVKVIDANNVIIENNKVINSYFAIHFSNVTNSTIRNNVIQGTPTSEQSTGNGIHLWKCNNILVAGNNVKGHRDGIYFEFVTESVIRDNHSEKNIRYGLHFMFSHNNTYTSNTFRNNGAGVAVMYSRRVKMEKNTFIGNWGSSAYGILLKDITDSDIHGNIFEKNTVGIHMEGSSRINIRGNMFNANGWAIRVQASCDDNVFSINNFKGNTFDVSTNGTMVLNKFSNNYWDKYEGYDLDKDGLGDIPYHPVSMYSMIVEQNPTAIILLRSFMVSLLDKAEKAIPSLTPENLRDDTPVMRPHKL